MSYKAKTKRDVQIMFRYSRLSLSRSPRDCMKQFEISVPRHIRFAELRKTINRTTTFNRMYLTPKLEIYWKYCGKELGAISPLFHHSLLPVSRSLC